MPSYSQDNRPLMVETALGKDKLLLIGFSGYEAVSELFRFDLEMLAANDTEVAFDKLVGKPMQFKLQTADGKYRPFNGICSSLSQGETGTQFTAYRAQVVPAFWLLTQRAQSRIFQQKSVLTILKDVLKGLKIDTSGVKVGYKERDFCVQYRETDFNFASRLMEEEGIFYFFTHSDGSHTLVLADSADAHVALPGAAKVLYKYMNAGENRADDVITEWSKTQQVTSTKVTLWDHCFEKPHQHLDQTATIAESSQVGGVTFKLKALEPEKGELYDWPGEYSQRFDGIDKNGGDNAGNLSNISIDGERTAKVRIQQQAATSVSIVGAGQCRYLAPGFKFTLATLPTDPLTKPMKADGSYVLLSVTHTARIGDYFTGHSTGFDYRNSFTCLPADLPFRPERDTPKPLVPGTQSAVVVGPKGEEIFTDKYGRVKVQFHWDREHKNDADSSCWIRVGTAWAGKQWGMLHLPRVGQEVLVDFLEGDPDQPVIVGSVFNADQMPAYKLPDERTKSYVKSNTSPGGEGFNEIRFEDKKDKQQIFIHAERNFDQRVKNDSMERVIGNRSLIVGYEKDGKKGGDQKEKVYQDKHLHVMRDQEEQIEGNYKLTVGKGSADDGGKLDMLVEKDMNHDVGGDLSTHVTGKMLLRVTDDSRQQFEKGVAISSSKDYNVVSGGSIHIKASQTLILEAGTQLSLKVGGNFVDISSSGVSISGTMVNINSGGSAGSGSGTNQVLVFQAKQAQPADPTVADDAKTGKKSAPN